MFMPAFVIGNYGLNSWAFSMLSIVIERLPTRQGLHMYICYDMYITDKRHREPSPHLLQWQFSQQVRDPFLPLKGVVYRVLTLLHFNVQCSMLTT